MKTYETESVPISQKSKSVNIGIGITIIAVGALFFLQVFVVPAPEKSPFVFLGIFIGGFGVFSLVRSIRQTHERVITAAGKAAIAAEKRIAAQHNSELWGWLFIAAVIAGAAYFFEPIADLFEHRIAVYPVFCSTSLTSTGACANHGEHVGDVTKYIVHVDQQLVVGLRKSAASPLKLFNCVVADRKNWSCSLQPEKDSERVVMHDGDFSYDPPANLFGAEHFTSRWRYVIAKYAN